VTPARIRFHLDENVDHAIAHGLRRHGIDVTVSSEVGLLSAPDEEQLAFALAQQRVIVTHDRDMLRLARRGVPYAGIAYIDAEDAHLGEMIQALLLIWGVMEPDEMMDHIEFL
jgi:predicted nuclease of predicted toxin-antitoxin system